MRIATPVSTLFNDAASAAAIVSASDCLECRDHGADVAPALAELFHFEAQLVHPWSERQRAFIADAVRARPSLSLVTFHCASCCDEPTLEGRMYRVGGTVRTRDEMLRAAAENVAWLRHALPASVEIGVENNNFYPTPAYEHVTDGDFLTRLVRENGLSFLLDLAHAHITAHNKGMPHEEYVRSLPLHAVRQLHICRSDIDAHGMAVDAHHAPDADVFAEVRGILSRHATVRYLTVEYYRDLQGLLEALRECREVAAGR